MKRIALVLAAAIVLIALPATAIALQATWGADPTATTACVLADGSIAPCPDVPGWLTAASDLGYDSDNQSRPFTYQSTTWIPVVPVGCNASPAKDAGADERYNAGCEPLAFTWRDSTGRTLNPDGSITP